jgi:hypothetical protein
VLLAGLSLARIASRPSCKYDSARTVTQSLQEFGWGSKNARLQAGRLKVRLPKLHKFAGSPMLACNV